MKDISYERLQLLLLQDLAEGLQRMAEVVHGRNPLEARDRLRKRLGVDPVPGLAECDLMEQSAKDSKAQANFTWSRLTVEGGETRSQTANQQVGPYCLEG